MTYWILRTRQTNSSSTVWYPIQLLHKCLYSRIPSQRRLVAQHPAHWWDVLTIHINNECFIMQAGIQTRSRLGITQINWRSARDLPHHRSTVTAVVLHNRWEPKPFSRSCHVMNVLVMALLLLLEVSILHTERRRIFHGCVVQAHRRIPIHDN